MSANGFQYFPQSQGNKGHQCGLNPGLQKYNGKTNQVGPCDIDLLARETTSGSEFPASDEGETASPSQGQAKPANQSPNDVAAESSFSVLQSSWNPAASAFGGLVGAAALSAAAEPAEQPLSSEMQLSLDPAPSDSDAPLGLSLHMDSTAHDNAPHVPPSLDLAPGASSGTDTDDVAPEPPSLKLASGGTGAEAETGDDADDAAAGDQTEIAVPPANSTDIMDGPARRTRSRNTEPHTQLKY